MDDMEKIQCPWCWELIELYIPPDTLGRMVEDCEVCCRPWQIDVGQTVDGDRTLVVARSN